MYPPEAWKVCAQSMFVLAQFREEEGGPFCERLAGAAGGRGWGGPTVARKEDVMLPAQGGWLWISDWQVLHPPSPPLIVHFWLICTVCMR